MADDTILLDTAALRVLAHPVRLRLLGLLRSEGPSTASRLAERLGLNSGATSYHLRKLAAGGLIAEDAERGSARDRWWRAVHRTSQFELGGGDPEERETGSAYLREVAALYADRMRQAAEEAAYLPAAWRAAGTFSDLQYALTPEEATRMTEEIVELMARYPRYRPDAELPEGAAPFVLQVQSFPRPGHLRGESGAE
ncbi:winged helix-turn-helix domain-containing protein [Phaeacidiphilus oryzae]|uniref:winged helix-turn-helix domain-containing protein n=1 Tax=Phaeacidiphilus oryzae TaxID=348818 RepID=UPI000689E970|nr:helix-turn-helix domain-containing protein [Phaeacidiphilus oryzae]